MHIKVLYNKKGGCVGAGGLDLIQNHLMLEKKTKQRRKKLFLAEFEPTTPILQILHLTC